MADEKEELEPKDGEGTEGEGKQQEPKQEEPKSKEGEGKSGEGESIKEFDYQSECHCSKTVRAKSSLRRRRTFWPIG